MHLSRRAILLVGLASALAACSGKSGLGEQTAGTVDLPGAGNVRPKPPGALPASVAMVGDSITAISHDALQVVLADMGFTSITINAEPSRRIEVGSEKPTPGLDVIPFIEASEHPGLWVVALGTNDAGLYSTDDEYRALIEDVLALIPADTPVVWMNVYREDQLEGSEQFNDQLRDVLGKRGNARIGEWYQQCERNDGDILVDGVHPTSQGILIFADTMRKAIDALFD